ncbi:double-strand break repair helicase AddA [Chelatococcus sp. GCM10030263]|uniref:double-strand break repair helicase AddA n=1 Tax=Chelatococcus sp. GCM10030263 TaxID=3273387 RepID=UPI003608B848
MSELVRVPLKTLDDQRRAANPRASAWVSANAGSGKTTVLANRVLRLLLAGSDPGRILCLTFTKAAAANMANRVFDELGRWVSLDSRALTEALERLSGERPSAAELDAARRLFARAIETPGGLKIETIHAFCERVLHLFPFEANVPARFEVLDDNDAADLLARARAAVMTEAVSGTAPALAAALARLTEEAADLTIDRALSEALRAKDFLRATRATESLEARLAAALGLRPGESRATIEREMLEGGIPSVEWAGMRAALAAGSKLDQDLAACFNNALSAENPSSRLACYQRIFFTQDGKPRADRGLGTKSVDPDLAARLRAERDRLVGLLERHKTALAVERTVALVRLASAVFARVEALKTARGALDFDDLIAATVALFARHEAAWVLYKLDAGIDHILVDEAQDTSPAQWRILKALAEEFTAGEGASLTRRTLFAVGDPKQSIYGFQGAAPREFDGSGRYFRQRTEAAGLTFEGVELTVSFRSAPEILAAVDAVFADPKHFKGLSFETGATGTVHESARPDTVGLVEIWEPERPADMPDAEAWVLPVDTLEEGSPAVRLARRIARAVAAWTRGEDGGPYAPGDILILVRKRGGFYEALIRALKETGVPVAGADRLKVTEHIAVRDLVAAGRAALLPADDLNLAALLKSPLVGLDDDDLIRIAAERPEGRSLYGALAAAAEAGDARAAHAVALIADWTQRARRGPFAFYAHLVGPGGGRRRLVARLGAEAGDAIDEFVAAALAHERRQAPSLAGFLLAFGEAQREVKRDLDTAHDEVRVMTVHGAKGLEARLVVLADGCDVPNGRNDPKLFAIPAAPSVTVVAFPLPGEESVGMRAADLSNIGTDPPHPPVSRPTSPPGGEVKAGTLLPVWSPKGDLDPPAVANVRAAFREEALEEHNRLLYVAMTRAKERLVVAAQTNIGRDAKTGDFKPLPEMCWPAMVRRSLEAGRFGLVEEKVPHGSGTVWRWRDPSRAPAAPRPAAESPSTTTPLPAWIDRPLPAEPEVRPPLRPSSALAAADQLPAEEDADRVQQPRLSEEARRQARLGGEFLHRLLQHLPERLASAEGGIEEISAILAARAAGLDSGRRAAIVAEALAVLQRPDLAPLFGLGSLAEVPIAGRLIIGGEELPVSGQIDRLAVTDEAVHVADFKTTQWPPTAVETIPRDHLAQLAVYAALLRALYPDRPLKAFLVYTRGPQVFAVPAAVLDAALAAIGRV